MKPTIENEKAAHVSEKMQEHRTAVHRAEAIKNTISFLVNDDEARNRILDTVDLVGKIESAYIKKNSEWTERQEKDIYHLLTHKLYKFGPYNGTEKTKLKTWIMESFSVDETGFVAIKNRLNYLKRKGEALLGVTKPEKEKPEFSDRFSKQVDKALMELNDQEKTREAQRLFQSCLDLQELQIVLDELNAYVENRTDSSRTAQEEKTQDHTNGLEQFESLMV